MLASDFQARLRKLNAKLHIFCGDDDVKAAGLYYVTPQGEYTEVCGVDKQHVPEFTEWSASGKIVKGGWRRTLQILVNAKLVDRRSAYKVFGYFDEHRQPSFVREKSAVDREIESITARGYWKSDEIVDVGRELGKRKSNA